jgi:putative hemolysin
MTRKPGYRCSAKTVRLTAFVGVAMALGLAACSYETGTGALAIGPDTYTMSKRYEPVGASANRAESERVANATQYCAQSGRQFVQLGKNPTTGSGNPYGPIYFTVTFQCVAPSDPGAATDQQQPPSQPTAR